MAWSMTMIALEIHRQELENNEGPDEWIEECVWLQGHLQSEWQKEADDSQQAVPAIGGMSL